MIKKPTPHYYLIDGSGFIFRAFHALRPLHRPDGVPVNAVYGFTKMLMKLLETTESDHLAVIFDSGRQNYRHDLYPNYKAHRPPVPEDLILQFPLIREACQALNVVTIELAGFEADDLLATYAFQATQAGGRVTIVSSDKDLMQLVNDQVDMFDPLKNKIITENEVKEKFGVAPSQVVDVQALAGDASDNVPGVPGIGPKGAAALIQEFGSLENLLENLSQISSEKKRLQLAEHASAARLSYQLVSLCKTTPLPFPLSDLIRKAPHRHHLIQFLKAQNFKTILMQIGQLETLEGFSTPSNISSEKKPQLETHYELIQTFEALNRWIQACRQAGVFAFDTETDSLNPLAAHLVGISLSVESGRGCYIPLAHKKKGTEAQTLFDPVVTNVPLDDQLPFQETLHCLKSLLEDPAILKIGHNIKYDALVLDKYDLSLAPVDDTIVLSYTLDGTRHRHGMDDLAAHHFDHTTVKYKDITGIGRQQITFDYVPLEQACAYAAEDADITLRLHRLFKPRLIEEQASTVYEILDRPLIPVLTDMERTGILVNLDTLKRLSEDFTQRLAILEQKIHGLAGRPFNIGSPKQMAEVLFTDLKYESHKKGKSGSLSTGADILEELAAQGHELPYVILEWRQLAKLKSTYTDALMAQINPKTGRVHTTYSQTITSTGRLASSNPNLQNIPIRTEEGRKIRAAFIAQPGHQLLSLDYSQIELRLMAHMASVESLKKAFLAGHDIHTATAAEVFSMPLDQVESEQRRRAKTINFGILYGMSGFGLARQLKIPAQEAAHFIKVYHQRYPEIKDFMDMQKEHAREKGYVLTLFGRKCYVAGIQDRNPMARSAAERQAINAPFQGTAADIMKKAMIDLHARLRTYKLNSKILLQVHDELILECPESEINEVRTLAMTTMSGAASLSVPLIIDTALGQTWDEAD